MATLQVIVTVLCFLTVIVITEAGQNTSMYFHRSPKSVCVLVNSSVEFECQTSQEAESADVVWYINNRVWSLLDPPKATWSSDPDPEWSSSLHTLHMPALREFNNSCVQCALILERGQPKIYSDAAVLAVRDSPFYQTPQSINATLESTVEFHCHPAISDSVVSWSIDNTSLSLFNSADVSEQDYWWNITRYTLYMTAHQQLNNSVVQCILNPSNAIPFASSEAILLIQGQLTPVRDLQVVINADMNYILISWTGPFSLDITDTDPDLWYSVTVHTTGSETLPSSDIVTDTYYNFTISNAYSRMYEFEVVSVNAVENISETEAVKINITIGGNNQCDSPLSDKTPLSTDQEKQKSSAASCSSTLNAMLSGIGIGVPVGVIVTMILAGILQILRYFYRHHFRSTSSSRKVKVQANISYERTQTKTVHVCRNEAYSTVMQRAGSPGVAVSATNPTTAGNSDPLYEYIN